MEIYAKNFLTKLEIEKKKIIKKKLKAAVVVHRMPKSSNDTQNLKFIALKKNETKNTIFFSSNQRCMKVAHEPDAQKPEKYLDHTAF